MKKGDGVIVKRNVETELWQIAGRQGHITDKDILGHIYVRINGYPKPFVLSPDEIELIPTEEK